MSGIDEIGILKTFWSRDGQGRWAIHGMKGITLTPLEGFERDYFAFENDMELMTSRPPKNIHDVLNSFGSTNFLVKQSIVPVVAWVQGEQFIKCIGTAFIISCSGYVVTAAHVLLDPQEAGYGQVRTAGEKTELVDGLVMGILMPISSASGIRGSYLIPFEEAWHWGAWRTSPLVHESDRFDSLTDIAICKLPVLPNGAAYQPLTVSLHPFESGEDAYAIGYAEMKDISVEYIDGQPNVTEFDRDLYVSVGKVAEVFPQNHVNRNVPTPGPSFDFRARIPGKMSGSPIFGAQGAVVRGVVSRSFSGEKHAHGCMIGPVMTLPLAGSSSIKQLMENGGEGIPRVIGKGL